MNKKLELKALARLLGSYKDTKKIAVIVLCYLVAAISMAVAPYMMGLAINEAARFIGNQAADGGRMLMFAIVCGIAYILYALINLAANNMTAKEIQRIIRELRGDVNKKIETVSIASYDQMAIGDITARLTNDTENIARTLKGSITTFISGGFAIVINFAMMAYVSPVLELLTFVAFIVIGGIMGTLTAASQSHYKRQKDKEGELNAATEEGFDKHELLALFTAKPKSIADYSKLNGEIYEATVEGNRMAGYAYPVSSNASNIVYIEICLVGIYMFLKGHLSIGMIQAFASYFTTFSSNLSQISYNMPGFASVNASCLRVLEFLGQEDDRETATKEFNGADIEGSISFDRVCFSYDKEKPLLRDVSFSVAKGQRVAIVGPTGAGKTTLTNLLMRFYEIDSGTITIDGRDIKEYTKKSLRSMFGMVLQETWLMSDSIMENVRYGRLTATDQEVMEAIRLARADYFVNSLPGKYEFVLNEGATNIADGEKQLLTLARAFLQDAPFLILDEATSAVDTRTEALITQAMEELTRGRTCFVIAHRLSTIIDSDLILYMEDGNIVESGRHEELMKLNGRYARLYNSQFAED